jgi:dihydroneopterin aldolase
MIRIRNIQFQGRHGASADERRSVRRFQLDVDLIVDTSRAADSDRLADTINYHDVCGLLVELGSSRPYRLLEKLAAEMVRAIREKWPQVDAVELELRKLHPPCPGNPDYTAVRVSG